MVDHADLTDVELVEAIDDEGEGLTPWEVGFVASLLDEEHHYGLSGVQRKKAEQIYRDRVHG